MDTHKHHQTHKPSEPDFGKEVSGEFHEAAEVIHEMGTPGKFDIGKEFKNAIEVIKLKEKKMLEVAASKQASLGSLIFIVMAIVIANLASYLYLARIGLSGLAINTILITALITFVSFIVAVFVYDFVGSYLFKGKGDFKQLFRVLGYGYLVNLIGIIPMLAIVGGIWYLVITYKTLTNIKKLDATNAVLTILITIVVVAVLNYIVAIFVGGGVFTSYGVDPSLIKF